MKKAIFFVLLAFAAARYAHAALVTDPNDARTWQGASVGTFAQLYFGADTLANRQLIIDKGLLDDGRFDTTGFFDAPLISCVGCVAGDAGKSTDTTGTGSYAYDYPSDKSQTYGGSHVDQYWIQTGGPDQIGGAVWDLGPGASVAIIFNTIDHGPLPLEAIESTVYLSNDLLVWAQAVTQKVWLEGYESNLGILWDGFTYAVGTQGGDVFRYASIVWGGPGGLQADGDNEINGVLGALGDFTPPPNGLPEPSTFWILGAALLSLRYCRKTVRT